MPNGNEGLLVPPLISNISIAQLFDLVKRENLANEIFSADVAKKLGVERAKGTLTDSLRFSISPAEEAEYLELAKEPILPFIWFVRKRFTSSERSKAGCLLL